MYKKIFNYQPLIAPNITVKDCLIHLENINASTGFVISKTGKLIAAFSNGDIRRGLLLGVTLHDNYIKIANLSPIKFLLEDNHQFNLPFHLYKGVDRIPVCDKDNVFQFVLIDERTIFEYLEDRNLVLHKQTNRKVTVLIQAGGFGTRMGTLTFETPKPMLKVNGKPLLQILVEQLAYHNLNDIYISVHYLSHIIKNYFKDGADFGVNIKYVDEKTPLGTCGSMMLIDENTYDDLILLNADLNTNIDFGKLYESHVNENADITVSLNSHVETCPFGVVKVENGKVLNIDEKPTTTYLISAGIYVLKNDAVFKSDKSVPMDMPVFIKTSILQGKNVVPYYIVEAWADIGTPVQLEKLRNDSLQYKNTYS